MPPSSLAEKIDKIVEDTTYMRARWESVIPPLVGKVDDHDKELDDQGKQLSNLQGKVSVVGAISGTIFGVIISWIYSKFK